VLLEDQHNKCDQRDRVDRDPRSRVVAIAVYFRIETAKRPSAGDDRRRLLESFAGSSSNLRRPQRDRRRRIVAVGDPPQAIITE
jgi:hypothetical protein